MAKAGGLRCDSQEIKYVAEGNIGFIIPERSYHERNSMNVALRT